MYIHTYIYSEHIYIYLYIEIQYIDSKYWYIVLIIIKTTMEIR